MIWIVSGVSSCGKSTFIRSPKAEEVTGLSFGTPVIFPFSGFERLAKGETKAFFHYNLMRPLFHILRGKPLVRLWLTLSRLSLVPSWWGRPRLDWEAISKKWNFSRDPVWSEFRGLRQARQAVVLATSLSTMLSRIELREHVEKKELYQKTRNRKYGKGFWASIYKEVRLFEIYSRWLNELEHCGINYCILDSTTDAYPVIKGIQELKKVINDERAGLGNQKQVD